MKDWLNLLKLPHISLVAVRCLLRVRVYKSSRFGSPDEEICTGVESMRGCNAWVQCMGAMHGCNVWVQCMCAMQVVPGSTELVDKTFPSP